MIQTTGVRAVKHDPLISRLPIEIDQKQSIDLLYNIEQPTDIRQIERVENGCLEIDYPVEKANSLTHTRLIESQFADHNAVDDLDHELIDQAICQLMPDFLHQEGLELPDDSIKAARVRGLLLKRVRVINSDNDLIDYLEKNPNTTQSIGLHTDCSDLSPTTLSRVRDDFGMDKQSVVNSVRRLQHVLFRNGILLETLSDDGYVGGCAIPLGARLPDHLRYQALLNWGDLLLRRLTDRISFNRGKSVKYSIREIIAALAAMTLHTKFGKGWRLAQLQYTDDIITHNRIHQIINHNIGCEDFFESKQAIEALSAEMLRNLFEFAADVGFFSKPLDIAFDSTWISFAQDIDSNEIPGSMGNINGNAGLCFATGASYTPQSRFSFGIKLITDKSKLPAAFRRMLRLIETFTEIGWILADREFDGTPTIELFRHAAEDTWIIRLRKNTNLLDAAEKLELRKEGKATISYGNTEMNGFWKETEKSDFAYSFGQQDSEFILISGQPLDDTTIRYLSKIYSNRWTAETHIRQLKHSFSPQTSGRNVLNHLFYFNISSIFYNIYKIINQSLSPVYGFPLRPRYHEVLWALTHSTFRCRSQPHLGINNR